MATNSIEDTTREKEPNRVVGRYTSKANMQPGFENKIAILNDEEKYYVHYNFDEEQGLGAATTGPFYSMTDARQDLKAHCPDAKTDFSAKEVAVRAAAPSCIPGYGVFVIGDEGVFLGNTENYFPPTYDNSGNTLRHVSDNEKMFHFLDADKGWVLSQAKLLTEGIFSLDDYAEYGRVFRELSDEFPMMPLKHFDLGENGHSAAPNENWNGPVPFISDPYALLWQKAFEEQGEYKAWLKNYDKDFIFDHAYEYATREDILLIVSDFDVDPPDAEALLSVPNLLTRIYKDYTKGDAPYMETLRSNVENLAGKLANDKDFQTGLETLVSLYDKGRAEQSTPRDTALDFMNAVGYFKASHTIAALVKTKNYDGRISDKNKEWAAKFSAYSAERLKKPSLLDKIHPAHIDQLADSMRSVDELHDRKSRKTLPPRAHSMSR